MRTDEDIKKDVVAQLYQDPRVNAAQIGVSVAEGIVSLSGQAPNHPAKNAVYDDAWTVAGVKSVINHIEVSAPTTAAPMPDADLKAAVQTALQNDTHIFAYKIEVAVKSQWVTLTGTVEANWQKRQAEELVGSVSGVTGVTNDLAVVPTEKMRDEMIARNVIRALNRDTNGNVDDITVTVKNGEVTLTGTVPSYAAKQAAYNSAYYAAGVVNVQDHTVISQHLLSEPV